MNFSDLVKSLSTYSREKITFIGLGNELRGDDAAGLIFLEYLKKREEFSESNYINAGTNPENYLEKILDLESDVIVIIDTARNSKQPGVINWINPDSMELNNFSTHTFSVKMIENYLKQLQPITFRYIGIEPCNTEFGSSLSPVIKRKLDNFFIEDKCQ